MMKEQTQSDCVTFHSHIKDGHSRQFSLVHLMQTAETFIAFSKDIYFVCRVQHLHYLTAAGLNWFRIFSLCWYIKFISGLQNVSLFCYSCNIFYCLFAQEYLNCKVRVHAEQGCCCTDLLSGLLV